MHELKAGRAIAHEIAPRAQGIPLRVLLENRQQRERGQHRPCGDVALIVDAPVRRER